jgi:predicted branched-subunit amino acid permease
MSKIKSSLYSPVAARWTLGFALSSVGWGFAFGIAATAKMSAAFATLMSGIVFSGTAQLLAVELWRQPLPIVAILLAALSVNARYLAMGATLAPLYAGRTRQGLIATALLSDASWVVALRAEREGHDPHAALLTSNALMWISWVGGTLGGAIAGYMLPELLLGVLGWFVLSLLAVLVPSLVTRWKDAIAPLAAALLAVLIDPWFSGSWHVLAAGLVGAAIAYKMGARDE